MKLFVTGASGFIAKHILVQALNAGHFVTGSLRNMGRVDEVRQAIIPHLSNFRSLENLAFVALDLTHDAGWPQALAGHDALIHTASPFPLGTPDHADDVIIPARDGTWRALTAAADAGVMRVVLTSSCAAIWEQVPASRDATEDDWTNPDAPKVSAYVRSKTIAEQLAWQIAKDRGLALSVINPSMVMGPPLDRHFGASVALVKRLMAGTDPMNIDTALGSVDVRDVARMHLLAVADATTAGHRFIANAGTLSFAEWGAALKAAYPDRDIPTKTAPRWMIRLMALYDLEIRSAVPMLGRRFRASHAKAQAQLGMTFTPPEQALLDSAAALVEMKLV